MWSTQSCFVKARKQISSISVCVQEVREGDLEEA